MNRTSKIFIYGIYSLVAMFFFLYYLFPSNLMRELLMEHVAQAQPDVHISIQQIHPIVPPGLKLEPFSVSYGQIPILHAEHLKVTPELFSLLSDSKKFAFKGSMGGGQLKGRAELYNKAKRPQAKIMLNLSSVPLDAIEILDQWPNYQPEGDLDAHINYDSLMGAGGTAVVDLEVGAARISIDPPLMGLEALEFSQITAVLNVTRRMLQIKRCEASGNQIQGKINGSIIFRQPMGNSRITLAVTIKPQPSFVADHKNDMIGGILASEKAQKRGVVFRFSGTLDNPRYVIR